LESNSFSAVELPGKVAPRKDADPWQLGLQAPMSLAGSGRFLNVTVADHHVMVLEF
jgi:hypothetical protein